MSRKIYDDSDEAANLCLTLPWGTLKPNQECPDAKTKANYSSHPSSTSFTLWSLTFTESSCHYSETQAGLWQMDQESRVSCATVSLVSESCMLHNGTCGSKTKGEVHFGWWLVYFPQICALRWSWDKSLNDFPGMQVQSEARLKLIWWKHYCFSSLHFPLMFKPQDSAKLNKATLLLPPL